MIKLNLTIFDIYFHVRCFYFNSFFTDGLNPMLTITEDKPSSSFAQEEMANYLDQKFFASDLHSDKSVSENR